MSAAFTPPRFWLGVLIVLLTACSAAPDTPTVAPTATLRPIVRPTVTPIASPTLAATATPAAPPTPTPDTRLMTTFAPDVNPLTGEKVSDPSVLDRRPLAIKIGNSTEVGVRPQAGASYADWVFEHETEGGIPRWTAVFYGETPDRVGGTRSCRIIDGEIPAIFKSLLACSGFSGGTREYYIKPADFTQEGRSYSPDFGDWTPIFFRLDNAIAPHNMFVNPARLWEDATAKGTNTRPDLSGLAFSQQPLKPGTPATELRVNYPADKVLWRYDPAATTCGSLPGCYLRFSGGAPQTDILNGEQLSAANVLVLYANHVEDGRYLEADYGPFKAFSLQIQLWNSGPAKLVRDGQVFDGTWNRFNRHDMLTFKDTAGNVLPLRPGNTWVELVRLDAVVETQP